MRKQVVMVFASMLVCGVLPSDAQVQTQTRQMQQTQQMQRTLQMQQSKNCSTTPTLDEAATAALTTALSGENGEYAARARYQAIIAEFGEIRPIARILLAEEKHIAALTKQCVKYGVPVPEDTYPGEYEVPETLLEAAQDSAEAEVLNAAMYEELLANVSAYPSLMMVFERLGAASEENHLPALLKLIAELE